MKRYVSLIVLPLIVLTILPSISAQIVPKAELYIETGNSAAVTSVVFSPDGKILASGSADFTVKIWDVLKKRELKTLSGHSAAIGSVAFSPDGRILASGSWDKTIVIWDVESGKVLKVLNGHTLMINSVKFTPDGEMLVSCSADNSIKIWDVKEGKERLTLLGHNSYVNAIAVDPGGRLLASGSIDKTIKIWDIKTGRLLKTLLGHTLGIWSLSFDSSGRELVSGSMDKTIKVWDLESGKELKTLLGHNAPISSLVFSPDGNILASGAMDDVIKIWDTGTYKEDKSLPGSCGYILSLSFEPNGEVLAAACEHKRIELWNVKNGVKLGTISGYSSEVNNEKQYIRLTGTPIWSMTFNSNGDLLAAEKGNNEIELWDLQRGKKLPTLSGHSYTTISAIFSKDGKILASLSIDGEIILWNTATGIVQKSIFAGDEDYDDIPVSLTFSLDGKKLATEHEGNIIRLWDVESGHLTEELNGEAIETKQKITKLFLKLNKKISGSSLSAIVDNLNNLPESMLTNPKQFYEQVESEKLIARLIENNQIGLYKKNGEEIIKLVNLNENGWIVSTSEGRFETSKSLDNIEGLHWIINDEILRPFPLDIFMRQYYEPDLLRRTLKCNEENNCDKEFKPLPSIAQINRIQPEVEIKEIKSVAKSSDLADVTIEVENVTENANFSTTDKFKRKKLFSGAYDLRLFRDGQLVGVSALKEKMEKFIGDAVRLVEEAKQSGKLIDTPEDRAWREANDIFKLSGENVKRISPTKIEYTFRNVKLPKDGRSEVSFTAYAFNSDKVKSATTEAVKFTIPQAVRDQKKKGRAVLISIGVNTSENPQYDLRYAANDARKMQEIVGAKLRADTGKYSEVVTIPLISDYKTDKTTEVNHAQKPIIKAVFSLLEGKSFDDAEAELFKSDPKLAESFRSVPNIEKLGQIEPEDTLIISFSGHGYADNAGIFYLLPHDIGKDTTKLTTKNLQKTISSDELSLWLQDITAAEMMLIIDACHSSAAVQSDGFKPGPMASRGLGQLSYDKDMKILSATQADNVAVELNSLQQGLLSYALLQDGIVEGFADTDKNKQLFSNEWLNYAEKRVPELYSEVKNGKRGVFVNGEKFADGRNRSEIVNLTGNQTININLQQPTLFDFKRRKTENLFLSLP